MLSVAFHGHERFRSWIPHGFDYLGPEETERQIRIMAEVRSLFRGAGYLEITPPALDFAPTFNLTSRSAIEPPFFETRGGEGDLLAVRSDLTVQVIKARANGRLGDGFPCRFSYVQPVFQDRSWGSGARRETLQAGVELIGEVEGGDRFQEILDLARSMLQRFGFEPRILYGDARFPETLFRRVPERARNELSLAFHNKDSGRLARLCGEAELPPSLARIFAEAPLAFGDAAALDRLEELCREETELFQILREARQRSGVIYDFSLVRELSYYTGPVFEAYVPGGADKVFTGGVYDYLYQEFSGEARPACGFALNLSILLENMRSTAV